MQIHVYLLTAFVVTSESSLRTKREKHDLNYKKTVLSLAKQHRSASDLEKVDRYYLPADDKVSQLLFVRLLAEVA